MAAFSDSSFSTSAFSASAFSFPVAVASTTAPTGAPFGQGPKKRRRPTGYENWNNVIWPKDPKEHPAVQVPAEVAPNAEIKRDVVQQIRKAAAISPNLVRELASELRGISDETALQKWAVYQRRRLQEFADEEALLMLGAFD